MSQPSTSGSSLTVLGGPLDGQVLDLPAGVGPLLIGSAEECPLRLELPGVGALHARLTVEPDGVVIHVTREELGVYVNDERVTSRHALRDADVVWLGALGDPTSAMLRYRAAAAPEVGADSPFFVADGTPPPMPPPKPSQAVAAEAFFVGESTEAPLVPEAAPQPARPSEPAPPPADEFFVGEPSAPAPASQPPVAPPVPAAEPPKAAPQPVAAPPPAPAPAARAAPGAPAAAAPRAAAPARPAAPAAGPPAAAPVRPSPQAAAPRPGASPEGQGLAAPRPERPRPSRPMPAAPRAARPAPRSNRGPAVALVAILLLVLGGAGGFFAWRRMNVPALQSLSPTRARAEQTVTLSGKNFAPAAQDNVVLFGDQAGRVLSASPDRLEVTVPDLQLVAGAERRVPVSVEVKGQRSAGLELLVHQGPRLHGLSPDVAEVGELVELTGAGWSRAAVVRFGAQQAEIVDWRPDKLRVRVPDLQGPAGSASPVTVAEGDTPSNAAPFLRGRLPLLLKVEPARTSPGEVVTISGRGFRPEHWATSAAVGPRRALVLQCSETELKLIVPRSDGGPTVARVALVATGQVSEIPIEVQPPADPIELRFVAEPLDEEPSGQQAVISTELGPAFVLSSTPGQSAALRALEAQKRLNEAAVALRASREADVEARGFTSGRPSIGLVGKPEALVEVTSEDAAAYAKDWTRQGPRARAVTPGRLASWWAALAHDLVLLLAHNEKPAATAALGAEGRVLQELYAAARKESASGVPRKLLTEAKPPLLQALRTLALRVPAGVAEPAGSPATGGPTAATGEPAKVFKLEGDWRGTEKSAEGSRWIKVSFRGSTGTLVFEDLFSVGLPLSSVTQPQRGQVRFSVIVRGSLRHYQGRFDGQKLVGTITAEVNGATLGSFELQPL